MIILEKGEIKNEIENILKASVSSGINEKCKIALSSLNEDCTNIKECIKERHEIIEPFVSTFLVEKEPRAIIIDHLHAFLAGDLLNLNEINRIVERISDCDNWVDATKLKILQMSYYFMKNEDLNKKIMNNLMCTILKLVDDKNKHISMSAKTIGLHLIDLIFFNALALPCNEGFKSDNEEVAGNSNCEEHSHDGEESFNESIKSKSEELPKKHVFINKNLRDEAISILKEMIDRSKMSLVVCSYTIEILVHIFKKKNLFKFIEIKEMFYKDLVKMVVKCINEDKISEWGEMHNLLYFFESSADGIKEILEALKCRSKDLKGNEPSVIIRFISYIRVLEGAEAKKLYSEVFFNVFSCVNFEENEKNIIAVENFLKRQLKQHANNITKNDKVDNICNEDTEYMCVVLNSDEVFLNDFSNMFYEKLRIAKNIKVPVEGIFTILMNYFASKNDVVSLESLIDEGIRCGIAEIVCKVAVSNRAYIQNSWHTIIKHSKSHVDIILNSLSEFSSSELFFLVKSIEDLNTENSTWTSKEVVDLYYSVFKSSIKILSDSSNIKIYEIILKSLSHGNEYSTEVFSRIVLEYFKDIGNVTVESQTIVFYLMKEIMINNLDRDGEVILGILLEVLRCISPVDGWDNIIKIIEIGCKERFYPTIFLLIKWVVEEFNDQIRPEYLSSFIGCLSLMCFSECPDSSMNALFLLQDIGECLLNRRMIEFTPNLCVINNTNLVTNNNSIINSTNLVTNNNSIINNTNVVTNNNSIINTNNYKTGEDLWIKYLGLFKDLIENNKENTNTIIKYSFAFIIAGMNIMMKHEWDFISNELLFTFFEECKKDNDATIILIKEMNNLVKQLDCNQEIILKGYLNILETGIIQKTSNEVRNISYNGLKIMITKSVTEDMQQKNNIKTKCLSKKEFHNDIDNYECTSYSCKKFRNLIFGHLKSIIKNIPLDSEEYPTDSHFILISILKLFSFTNSELQEFYPYLGRLLKITNENLQTIIIELLNGVTAKNIAIKAYRSWIDTEDDFLTFLILEKIGNITPYLKDDVYIETMMFLAEFTKHANYWELTIESFKKGSENIKNKKEFNCFVKGSKIILEESQKILDCAVSPKTNLSSECINRVKETNVNKTSSDLSRNNKSHCLIRKKERVILDFLANYENVVLSSANIPKNEIYEAYKVILALTNLNTNSCRENILCKYYKMLFHNIDIIYEEFLPKIKSVLSNYNEMEAIYNNLYSSTKQKEVYIVLNEISSSGDKKLVNDVKYMLVECLKSKDFKVIEYVRKSLEILFL